MTIAIAWERTVSEGRRELVVACDSKLTGGEAWEGCPKLFTFERDDCVLAFAGDTYYAYPAAVQVSLALSSHYRIRDRAKDIVDVAAFVVDVLNGMLSARLECAPPDTSFLFAGWSWRRQRFSIWIIERPENKRKFRHRPVRARTGGALAVLGHPAEAAREYRRHMVDLGFFRPGGGSLPIGWEPLQVLCHMIRSGGYRAVGGPPQLAKVYPYSKSQVFCVYWRIGSTEALTLRGRYTLPYELPDNTVLDADTFETFASRSESHLRRSRDQLLRLLRAHVSRLEGRTKSSNS